MNKPVLPISNNSAVMSAPNHTCRQRICASGSTLKIMAKSVVTRPSEMTKASAPHTKAGYLLPPSKALFVVGSTFATRSGLRKARAAGLA